MQHCRFLTLAAFGALGFGLNSCSSIFYDTGNFQVTGTIVVDKQIREEETKNFLYITDSENQQTDAIIDDHLLWGISNSGSIRGAALSNQNKVCTVTLRGERKPSWSIFPYTISIDNCQG